MSGDTPSPGQVVLQKRVDFLRRVQQENESPYTFMSAVTSLASECSFNPSEESFLVRDKFIAGIKDRDLASKIIAGQGHQELTPERALHLATTSAQKTAENGIKQEVYMNEAISDIEACLKVNLTHNYDIMNTISYRAKADILLELLNSKATISNQRATEAKKQAVWQKVFAFSLRNGTLFDSVEHLQAIFERWKEEAFDARKNGVTRPQSGDPLIFQLFDGKPVTTSNTDEGNGELNQDFSDLSLPGEAKAEALRIIASDYANAIQRPERGYNKELIWPASMQRAFHTIKTHVPAEFRIADFARLFRVWKKQAFRSIDNGTELPPEDEAFLEMYECNKDLKHDQIPHDGLSGPSASDTMNLETDDYALNISEEAKSYIISEIVKNKGTLTSRGPNHEITRTWTTLYAVACAKGGKFDSMDQFKAMVLKWKRETFSMKKDLDSKPSPTERQFYEGFNGIEPVLAFTNEGAETERDEYVDDPDLADDHDNNFDMDHNQDGVYSDDNTSPDGDLYNAARKILQDRKQKMPSVMLTDEARRQIYEILETNYDVMCGKNKVYSEEWETATNEWKRAYVIAKTHAPANSLPTIKRFKQWFRSKRTRMFSMVERGEQIHGIDQAFYSFFEKHKILKEKLAQMPTKDMVAGDDDNDGSSTTTERMKAARRKMNNVSEEAKLAILRERLRYNDHFAGWDKERMNLAIKRITEVANSHGIYYDGPQKLIKLIQSWQHQTKRRLRQGMQLNDADNLCIEIFNIKGDALSHECPKCGDGFETFRELQEHTATVHKRGRRPKFPFPPDFSKRPKFEMNDPREPFDVPPKEIPLKDNPDAKMAPVDTGPPPEEFTLFCQECQMEFENYTDTRRHKKEVHGISEPAWNGDACTYCGQKHRPKIMLRLHVRTSHPNRPFLCDHCDDVSTRF